MNTFKCLVTGHARPGQYSSSSHLFLVVMLAVVTDDMIFFVPDVVFLKNEHENSQKQLEAERYLSRI